MVFKQNLIVVVKCRDKVLRESSFEGTSVVTLPFGSDYSILLKNKDARKAVVKVEIDGKDVLGGSSIVLHPNTDQELLGFMEGNAVRNMFRFIQKTDEVVAHRGDRVDDGIIRVEYRFEQKVEEIRTYYHPTYTYPYWTYHPPFTRTTGYPPEVLCGTVTDSTLKGNSGTTRGISSGPVDSGTYTSCSLDTSFATGLLPEEGITIKGQETHQQFHPTYVGALESQAHVITILLKGTTTSGFIVTEPVTVSAKLICSSCGRSWGSDMKYCPNCGTVLVFVFVLAHLHFLCFGEYT